jgi:hypothetical protein
VESNPHWVHDIAVFMTLMGCASAELGDAQERAAYLGRLSQELAGTTIQWRATLRRVRGDRLAFEESFAALGTGIKAVRAMYYAAPTELGTWQRATPGQEVGYAGEISAVRVDTLASARPLLYVEIRRVRRTADE